MVPKAKSGLEGAAQAALQGRRIALSQIPTLEASQARAVRERF
jgi:hypothetical protein